MAPTLQSAGPAVAPTLQSAGPTPAAAPSLSAGPTGDSDTFRLSDFHATNFETAIQHLTSITHHGSRPEPCCGSQGHLIEEADASSCVKVGANDLGSVLHNRDASDTFGDNVGIERYKYYLEDCSLAGESSDSCSYTEITDPDISGHVFKVGVSNVKIRATDMSDNIYECIRTIYLYDKQPPYFTDPDFVPMHPNNNPDEIEVDVPADSCVVQNEAGFIRHFDLGFNTDATDNCDVAGKTHFGLRASDPGGVHLRKLIFAYNPDAGLDTSNATLLYDSDDSSTSAVSTSADLVPGTYHMKYMLIDDFSEPFHFPSDEDLPEWHQFNHSVLLTVKDKTPPTSIDECPADIYMEIEPWEMSAVVTWTVPQVDGDNCLGTGAAPPPPTEFQDQYPGMTMSVGAHIVKYSFVDAHGNPYDEECIFEVRIVHKNHPINVTCPPLVVFDTLPNSDFAIVEWPAPVAVQNGQTLDASHITYEPSVAPGMPFPYGETTIKVIATGQNYTAVQEGHQTLEMDECFFKVRVGDPQSPKCDGREYRCADPESSAVRPYSLCDGPELVIDLHEHFEVTSEYETKGVMTLAGEACCTSETEVEHVCSVIEGTGSKQCKPVSR
jgi:hypothetical protein